MNESFNTSVNITINAPAEAIWQALVDPAIFKQWMYGSIVTSDWQKGSSITYSGEWKGKPYEDKGTIIDIVPNQLLRTTFFSPLTGKEDIPENHQIVTYRIDTQDNSSILTISQENNDSEEAAARAKESWESSLKNIKKIVEQ